MTVNNKTRKNPRYTRKQMQYCKKDFCKLYSNKFFNYMQSLQKKKIKGKNKFIKEKMKQCKFTHCNIGCKGTLLEEGKKFPKLNEKMVLIYDLKKAKTFRKKFFKNKKNALEDNVPYNMPLKIKKKYLEKGALSICEHYIKDGSFDLVAKQI